MSNGPIHFIITQCRNTCQTIQPQKNLQSQDNFWLFFCDDSLLLKLGYERNTFIDRSFTVIFTFDFFNNILRMLSRMLMSSKNNYDFRIIPSVIGKWPIKFSFRRAFEVLKSKGKDHRKEIQLLSQLGN